MQSVAAFLPGRFAGYLRIYHPLHPQRGEGASGTRWSQLAQSAAVDLRDTRATETLRDAIRDDFFVERGTLSVQQVGALTEVLAINTTTNHTCYFGFWDGDAHDATPDGHGSLSFGLRQYHMFIGPIGCALTSMQRDPTRIRSANLWWPQDHAWCVASDVDLFWTYVGGSKACIDMLQVDARLESVRLTGTETR